MGDGVFMAIRLGLAEGDIAVARHEETLHLGRFDEPHELQGVASRIGERGGEPLFVGFARLPFKGSERPRDLDERHVAVQLAHQADASAVEVTHGEGLQEFADGADSLFFGEDGREPLNIAHADLGQGLGHESLEVLDADGHGWGGVSVRVVKMGAWISLSS